MAGFDWRDGVPGFVAIGAKRLEYVCHGPEPDRAPTVVMLEWIDPIFSMGNWGPELVEAAHGRVLLGEKGQHSKTIPWDQVREADPDFLIIAPCGFGLERTLREAPMLEELPGWNDLKSVRAGNIALADGNLYFNRSGTTIVETVEIIAQILHGHRATADNHHRAWHFWTKPNSPRSDHSVLVNPGY